MAGNQRFPVHAICTTNNMADKTFKRCEEEAFALAETFEKRHLTNKEIAEIFHTVVESRMPKDNGFHPHDSGDESYEQREGFHPHDDGHHPQGSTSKGSAYANYWDEESGWG